MTFPRTQYKMGIILPISYSCHEDYIRYSPAPCTAHRKYSENVNCFYNYYYYHYLTYNRYSINVSLLASTTRDNLFLQNLLSKQFIFLITCECNFSFTKVCTLTVRIYTVSHTLQMVSQLRGILKRKKIRKCQEDFFFPFKDNIFLRKGVAAYKNDKKLSEQSWSIAK